MGRTRRLAAISACGVAAFAVLAVSRPSAAQERPPESIKEEVNPKIIPGLVKPAAPSGRRGPLAQLADNLADQGIVFHALSIDFFTANATSGLQPGNTGNSLYNILGVDVDLSKRTEFKGTSLYYKTTVFAANTNLDFLGQAGDTLTGYQGTFNKRAAVISVATVEQRALDDRLAFEIGRAYPVAGRPRLEPVVQYAINPNSFYNPLTFRRPRDGIFAIGTLIVPVGILLGLSPG